MNLRGMALVASLATVLAWTTAVTAQPNPGAGGASADKVAQSEAYASQAFDAYRSGDVSEAISLYLKALEASPSANILYNLAKIYDLKVRDRNLAMSFYRRYIADPGADPDRVRQVNERLIELRELELAANEPGATGAGLGGAGQGAGAGAGARNQFGGSMERPVQPEDRGMSGLRIAGIVTGAAGLVGLGVGAAFGFSARGKNNDAKCDGDVCASAADVQRAKDADRLATISTVSTIGGAALAVAGTVMFLVGNNDQERQVASSGFQFSPVVAPDMVGSYVSARW